MGPPVLFLILSLSHSVGETGDKMEDLGENHLAILRLLMNTVMGSGIKVNDFQEQISNLFPRS